jgi:hypothetical protein
LLGIGEVVFCRPYSQEHEDDNVDVHDGQGHLVDNVVGNGSNDGQFYVGDIYGSTRSWSRPWPLIRKITTSFGPSSRYIMVMGVIGKKAQSLCHGVEMRYCRNIGNDAGTGRLCDEIEAVLDSNIEASTH